MAYSYKDIWKVSLPIMLGLLTQNVMQITNTIFLGRVGEVEFGAAGLAGIYYIAFFMLGFGFSIGAQIMIGRRNGEKNYDQIGTIVLQGMMFLLVFAALLYGLSNVFSKTLLPTLIKSHHVYEAASEYLQWRTFGFFFASVNIMFRAFYVGIARTSVLTLNAVVMTVVNIIFDYVLIFGNFGFPQLGIAGAGMASVIAEISSIIFFVIYTFKTVDLGKYGFHKMKFRFSVIKRILNISVFTMAQYAISMSTWFIFFLAIENHGERDLAITNIIRTFYMIYFIPMNALSTTANTLVSNTMGMSKYGEVWPLIKRICLLSLGIVVLMGLFTLVKADFWIGLIASNKDMSLVQETIMPLIVLVCALPICSLGTVLFNSISGTGNTRWALIFEMITIVLYVGVMYVVVIHNKSSVAVCWTVEYVYWGTLMVLSYLYLTRGKWQNKSI
ncbi:MATE family efflux transporter [Dysgonomonas sp. HDW5B]|uniref:MATE family efflux transporter n=1 Tax=Dysgonomonas sp. HDW5B TaxID=2714927 RepID=UPI002105E2B8|nr:MATE family efflux transporter [Dysgonomonas sp. HDW5B]